MKESSATKAKNRSSTLCRCAINKKTKNYIFIYSSTCLDVSVNMLLNNIKLNSYNVMGRLTNLALVQEILIYQAS